MRTQQALNFAEFDRPTLRGALCFLCEVALSISGVGASNLDPARDLHDSLRRQAEAIDHLDGVAVKEGKYR